MSIPSNNTFKLNERAHRRAQLLMEHAEFFGAKVHDTGIAAVVVDCGASVPGGLELGRILAEVCMADLGTVSIGGGNPQVHPGPALTVRTDHPVQACMASQYAGWRIAHGGFFAMGSGPMRAAAGKEELFESIGYTEPTANVAVGILETRQQPSADLTIKIADEANVDVRNLTLLYAPTGSLAGTVQVVARSVETALHKFHELGFDVSKVVSGFGTAPLPPVAADDLQGIGRTNDAILYGGEVTLWVHAEDDMLGELVAKIPSSASSDHGAPFGELFERYDRDFYKIDPQLFSPAVVIVHNLKSGRTFRAGEMRPDVLERSFA